MEHQDWTPVVLKKPVKLTTEIVSKMNKTVSPVKTNENDEVVSIKKVTKKMADIIIKSRIAKKWTQTNLANACSIDVKTINEIERAYCVYNAEHINKIAKNLNVKIPREFN